MALYHHACGAYAPKAWRWRPRTVVALTSEPFIKTMTTTTTTSVFLLPPGGRKERFWQTRSTHLGDSICYCINWAGVQRGDTEGRGVCWPPPFQCRARTPSYNNAFDGPIAVEKDRLEGIGWRRAWAFKPRLLRKLLGLFGVVVLLSALSMLLLRFLTLMVLWSCSLVVVVATMLKFILLPALLVACCLTLDLAALLQLPLLLLLF